MATSKRRLKGLHPPHNQQAKMAAVLAAIRGGASTIRAAAAIARVGKRTVHEWIRKGALADENDHENCHENPYWQFLQDYWEAEHRRRLGLEVSVEKASADDWRAAAYLLDRADRNKRDVIQESWEELTVEEQLTALGQNEQVQRAVLAELTKSGRLPAQIRKLLSEANDSQEQAG